MGTKATREELGDYAVVSARLFEFVKDGKRPASAVIAGMQRLADGQFPQKELRLDRYNHLLLSPADQLERLRRYNAQYWDNRLTDEQLAAVDTSGDSTQRVDDLTIFHVQFGSLEETIEMWWRVYVGEQLKHWRWPELQVDAEHLRLLGSNVRQYEPGIHRVRINLVAHWEPEDGRTLEEVQEQAGVSGEILAQLEVMSTYGIHSELLREQDGENLPYSDMPGTDVSVPGLSRRHALCVSWYLFSRRADLNAHRINDRNGKWAAPVVLRESEGSELGS